MNRTTFLLIGLALAGIANAAPPARFDARVETVRRETGVPGLAIAIVEDGRTTLARGYGVRQLGAPALVDADTLFPIGSTSKAFTVAALATLVDAGKIDWDDRVIDHLPGFRMYDPWVTREMTVRDLLVHRSGIGEGTGDLLFVPRSNVSRAEVVRRVRYFKPATSFRTTFAYSNLMYVVAGQLIETVSGERWEDYVRHHVLLPAGMTVSTTDNEQNFATEDRAYPHARMNGGLRGAGDQQRLDERDDLGRNAAPAGGIASSASDLAKWLQVQLAAGAAANGKRVFSSAAHEQMWQPVVEVPISPMPPELKAAQPHFSSYALAWDVIDYRGVRVIWHGGAVFGFKTAVVLVPDKKLGFAITINSEDGALVRGLMYELLDHYLGAPFNDWPAKYRAHSGRQVAEGLGLLKAAQRTPAKVGPSAPASALAGTYSDPWYGNIDIASAPSGLTIDFKSTPRMSGRLEHWQYDTYITRFDDPALEPAYVTFALDGDGKVARVTMKAASPIADFSWDYQDLAFTPVVPGTKEDR
ncbi:CubicO group peptidase (beta-lactamase class C family) [Pseudoduganella lurida]|uniref:CubicO group peptidase (Beta-lactamase class C family) n=1 Tax=Pseudoduganella lurida TaxID=1036180 RepID=A0A562RKT5_9BURK|nr:serine hydrolase [Pseudoduganella lurida]TWI69214.1 CubicO group peptidase (beta-lactamase class C family) [Pseudoduganella lurida]